MYFFEFLLAICCFFLYNMLLKGKRQMNRNNKTDNTNSNIPNIEENTNENTNIIEVNEPDFNEKIICDIKHIYPFLF